MLSPEDIKRLIGLFNSPAVQAFLPDGLDIWGTCDLPQPNSTFRDVFTASGGRRKLAVRFHISFCGPIYGPESAANNYLSWDTPIWTLRDLNIVGLEDEGGIMIMDLIEEAADGPVQGRPEAEQGFLDYCWTDPSKEGADEIDDGSLLTAPGDSWKTNYVVDPFDYLGIAWRPLILRVLSLVPVSIRK